MRSIGLAVRWLSLVTTLAALSATSAFSQQLIDPPPVGNDHQWDCWISTDDQRVVGYFIRCIRDRDVIPDAPPPDSPQAVLLDLIHERIHQGHAQEIDRDLNAGRLEEVLSHIWRIRIHQYPYEESWQQERPQMLVQSLLCKLDAPCLVLVHR